MELFQPARHSLVTHSEPWCTLNPGAL